MVLLDVLSRLQARLGLRLYVAHVHHGLRGRAADRDAAFVVAEAARRGLGASVCRLDPAKRPGGESVQGWARATRYESLEAIAQRVQASWIAVAHTRDDQAETLLLNLLRGTGPRGLRGIPPVRQRILRPLLTVARAEVEAYAAARCLAFRTDASNASDLYRRNRVRHHLLPLLAREYNPRIVESLAALASLMREDDAPLTALANSLLAQSVREAGDAICLGVRTLREAPPAVGRRIFQEAFQKLTRNRHSLTRRHLEALKGLLVGDGIARLPGGFQAQRQGTEIRITPAPGSQEWDPRTDAPGTVPVPLGTWTPWPPFDCRIRVRRVAGEAIPSGGQDRWRQVLSPELLRAPLVLRAWRPGDRFRPLGMAGKKKLQDFFVDAKVPCRERARIPLLLAGERIAWVIGQRIAEDFRFLGEGPACLAEIEFVGEGGQSKTNN